MGFFIAKFFIALIILLLGGIAFSIGYYFVKKNKEEQPEEDEHINVKNIKGKEHYTDDSYDKDDWCDF